MKIKLLRSPGAESGIIIVMMHANNMAILEQQINRARLPILSMTIPSTGLATAEIMYGVSNQRVASPYENPNFYTSIASLFPI